MLRAAAQRLSPEPESRYVGTLAVNLRDDTGALIERKLVELRRRRGGQPLKFI